VAAAGGRPRDQGVHVAILRAAATAFAEGGVAGVSFDGVAQRAGVSRSSIYRRWRTRDELVVAALEQVRQEGEAGAEDWESLPLVEVLALFVDRSARALADPRSIALLRQVTALPPDSPVRQTYWDLLVAPRRAVLDRMITDARSRGELTLDVDLDLLQDQLAGALLYRALVHPEVMDEAEARRYVAALVTALLGPPDRDVVDR